MATEVLTAKIVFDMGKLPGSGGDTDGSDDVESGNTSRTGRKTKQSTGVLKKIFKRLLPLAALLSLKPIADTLSAILQFAVFGIIKLLQTIWDVMKLVWQGIKNLWTILKLGWQLLTNGFNSLIETIKEWWGNAIEWIKALPEKIWNFIQEGFNWIVEKIGIVIEWFKELPGKLWGFIKEGFNWVVEKLTDGWDKLTEIKDTIIEWFTNSIDWIKSLPSSIWELLKTGFNWIKDGVTSVWNSIKSLPQLIWDKMQRLGSIIADAIKGSVRGFFGGGSQGTINVDDAIITKDGKIIKTHPNDTIIATQNPGGMGGNKVFNFYGVTPREMMDVIKKELANDVNMTSRF